MKTKPAADKQRTGFVWGYDEDFDDRARGARKRHSPTRNRDTDKRQR